MQYLKPCLRLNLITFFATIEDLFNHLEDIFDNLPWKKHVMEKFRDLKMGARSFNNFYSEFIRLASELEYTSEKLIREFKHKLTPRIQDGLNSGIELSSLISALAKHCLSIYEQMQAIDRIRDRTKLLQSTQSSVSTNSSVGSYQLPAINTRANTPLSCLSSSISGTMSSTPRHSEKERAWLMKEGRYFSCKKKDHTTYGCLKKGKIAAISEGVSEGSDSQGKE